MTARGGGSTCSAARRRPVRAMPVRGGLISTTSAGSASGERPRRAPRRTREPGGSSDAQRADGIAIGLDRRPRERRRAQAGSPSRPTGVRIDDTSPGDAPRASSTYVVQRPPTPAFTCANDALPARAAALGDERRARRSSGFHQSAVDRRDGVEERDLRSGQRRRPRSRPTRRRHRAGEPTRAARSPAENSVGLHHLVARRS